MKFSVNKDRFSLIDQAEFGGRRVISPDPGDSPVRIRESRLESDGRRYLYCFVGGTCKASVVTEEYRATIEESGLLRTVIRLDGAYQADYPMGAYSP